MSTHSERSGLCLCGAVRVHMTPRSGNVDACHCTMCRRWSGGPFLGVDSEGALRFEGEEAIAVYASSEWAERGFCRHCGTHLFWRLRAGGHWSVPVGLLDEGEPWRLASQIFIEEKPRWYSFAEPTTNLTGEEVFAKLSPQSD